MEQARQILFGPFRLDPVNKQLWRGEQEVVLRAKSLAVLQYLPFGYPRDWRRTERE